jgi:DNA helicase MCM8
MSPALLSRFDLIFILLDKPDEEMDLFLSEHVMKIHSGKLSKAGGSSHGGNNTWEAGSSRPARSASQQHQNNQGEAENDDDDQQQQQTATLSDRLRIRNTQDFDPIPIPLLRKYIAYARQYVQPRLTVPAAQVLQSFYLTLRSKYRSMDSTPITTRQLESLIRLSEARARLELRETVTQEDAEDVVELMKCSLFEAYEDECGNYDLQRSQLGTGMSKKGEPKRFIASLQQIARETCNTRFTYQQLYQIAKEMNMRVNNFQDFLDSLNNQGYLLKKGNRVYQISIHN